MTPYTNYSSELNRAHREAMMSHREQIRLAKLARREEAKESDAERTASYKKHWAAVRRVFATAPPTLRYAYMRQAYRT